VLCWVVLSPLSPLPLANDSGFPDFGLQQQQRQVHTQAQAQGLALQQMQLNNQLLQLQQQQQQMVNVHPLQYYQHRGSNVTAPYDHYIPQPYMQRGVPIQMQMQRSDLRGPGSTIFEIETAENTNHNTGTVLQHSVSESQDSDMQTHEKGEHAAKSIDEFRRQEMQQIITEKNEQLGHFHHLTEAIRKLNSAIRVFDICLHSWFHNFNLLFENVFFRVTLAVYVTWLVNFWVKLKNMVS